MATMKKAKICAPGIEQAGGAWTARHILVA